MRYTYQPLPGPRSIRLLSFSPCTSSPDLICVQLHIVDLDSECLPGYWGLSYTWGNPLPSCPSSSSPPTQREISCDGKSFLVGSNLYDFLKRFNGNRRYYWIDAICINQSDISERNAQVSIMVWIYSKAEGTFIWLGESDNISIRSLDLLVKFAEAKKRLGEDRDKILRRRWEFNDVEFYAAMGIEPWSQEDWKVLLDFYTRSWFRRQWVLQEVIANDQALVFCGARGMPWPYFMDLTQFMISQRWEEGIMALESGFHKAGSPSSIRSTYDFVGLLDRKNQGPAKPSTDILLGILSDYRTYSQRFDAFVLYTVYRMRGREATNPADHVYAPLSLATKFKTEKDSSPKVDYGLSVVQIYKDFSSHLMRVPRPMVLAFREDDTARKLTGLPSWVPDYSVRYIGTPLAMSKAYIASGKDIMWPNDDLYVVRQNRLHMKGIRIDSICEVTDQIQPNATAAALFDLLRVAFHHDSSLTSQAPLESLVRTICANIIEERSSFSVEDIFGWFARWFCLISRNPTQLSRLRESLGQVEAQDWDKFWRLRDKSLLPTPNDQNAAFAEAETWHDSPELQEFLSSFVMGRRCLALTGNRRALALTPLSAKSGDEIWILFNGRTPYVLRKIDREEQGYYFVGESYVHGFMDGELFLRDKEEGIDVSIKPVVLI